MARQKEIDVSQMINNAQLSDTSAMKLINERNTKRAEERRKHALEREERYKKELEKTPTEIEARESVLIPMRIKHKSQDMEVKIPIDNSRIIIVATNNCEHIGNALYALKTTLPIRVGRAKANTINDAIEEEFKKTVITTIVAEQKFAKKTVKEYGGNTAKIDELIVRSTQPTVFNFRSRDVLCTKWLNWCYQADLTALLMLKLSHLGYLSERDYYEHVTHMVSALERFCNFIYTTRREAMKALEKTAQSNDVTDKEETSDEITAEESQEPQTPQDPPESQTSSLSSDIDKKDN